MLMATKQKAKTKQTKKKPGNVLEITALYAIGRWNFFFFFSFSCSTLMDGGARLPGGGGSGAYLVWPSRRSRRQRV